VATETLAVNLLLRADQYKREARSAATATGQISNQANTAGTATGNLDKKMGALAQTAKFAVAGAATAAVVKFGKDSVQAFLGFDDAMNQSLAIMGDVSSSMRNEMSDAAREIGRSTRIGAEEAAESFFFLASAGLDAEQSIAALPQVAAFAQAGMFDMARATDLATDAQSALGLTVPDAVANLENLTRVTDVFVRSNTLANTTVEQIAEAMTTRAGPALRALNKDIEEGAAVLAAMADQGIKGAEAGTQLGIVIRDLQTKAIDNADAFREANIAVFDSNEKMRNLGDIIADVEGRMDGMSDAAKRAELSQLGFSDRSIAVITTLLGTSDAIREYERELRNAGGTTKDVADKQLKSFQGQMDLLGGRMDDLKITLGEALVPALIEATGAFVEMAESMKPLISLLGQISQGFTDIRQSSEWMMREDANPFEKISGAITKFATQGSLQTLADIWDMFTSGADSADDLSGAAKELSGEFSTLGGEMSQIPPLARDTAGELTDAEQAARDFYRTSGDLSGELGNQGGRWDDVITSMENYEDMIRRLTDPVFKAIDDQNRLAKATENYHKVIADPESTVGEQEQAFWDLLEAQIAVDESSGKLPENLDDVAGILETVATRAGVAYDQLWLVDSVLDDLDGRRVDIEVAVRRTGAPLDSSVIVGAETGYSGRQHGGPVRAGQPYVVGEAGPELFIPQQSGTIIPNSQTSTGTAPMGGGTTLNVFTLTWGDFVEKARDAGIETARLGW
jgi:TP901 family phage tail tape measure protein